MPAAAIPRFRSPARRVGVTKIETTSRYGDVLATDCERGLMPVPDVVARVLGAEICADP